jgi:protein tyrosine phosphatase (PTP) superfamily phosphohydrolase (DUF442 family)
LTFFCLALFGYGIYNVYAPENFPMNFVQGKVRQINDKVIVGPYPTEHELYRLKKRGVTKVISLMNPGMPFESSLISIEKENAKGYGIEFVNIPMSYLLLGGDGNKDQLENILDEIMGSGEKTVYVHCYLGRHRMELVARGLEARRVEGAGQVVSEISAEPVKEYHEAYSAK